MIYFTLTRYFSFVLPIWIICFFLGGCSKLGDRYSYDVAMETDAVYGNSSEMNAEPYTQSFWRKKLFSAIRAGQIGVIESLLNDISQAEFAREKLYDLDEEDNTCLHIAAGESSSENAVKVMSFLLEKLGESLIQKWDWNHKDNKKGLSPLLLKNARGETPLLMAMKRGNEDMLKLCLRYTHDYVGLNNAQHKNCENNDLISIALKKTNKRQPMFKLYRLLDEVYRCSSSNGIIHNAKLVKCQTDNIVNTIKSNGALSKAVNNGNLCLVNCLLSVIETTLGPKACYEALKKKYSRYQNYTVLHTALDKGGVGEEDENILIALVEKLLSCCSSLCKDFPDKDKDEADREYMTMKGRLENIVYELDSANKRIKNIRDLSRRT